MSATSGQVTVSFGPAQRAAPDDLWIEATGVLQRARAELRVLAQQLSDPRLVNAMLLVANRRGIRVRTILEEDYLFDDTASATPWTPGGRNEAQRDAFAALARGAIRVRLDGRGGSLLHTNVILARDTAASGNAVYLSSANFTRSNLTQHLNAAVCIVSDPVATALASYFDQVWATSRAASTTVALPVETGALGTVTIGTGGVSQDQVIAVIDAATSSVDLAMFNLALGNPGFDAVDRALDRGVHVRGVVDGDQRGNAWDAVPALRAKGADVRYLDGIVATGLGRMHQKTVLVDDRVAAIGTGNLSMAARQAHELVVVLDQAQAPGPWPMAQYVKLELDRLFVLAPLG